MSGNKRQPQELSFPSLQPQTREGTGVGEEELKPPLQCQTDGTLTQPVSGVFRRSHSAPTPSPQRSPSELSKIPLKSGSKSRINHYGRVTSPVANACEIRTRVESEAKKKCYVWSVLKVTHKMSSYHGVLLPVEFRPGTKIELKKAINLFTMLVQVDFLRVNWVTIMVTIQFRNELF